MSTHLPVVIDSARLAEALARFPRDRMTWIDWTSLGAGPSRTTLNKCVPRSRRSSDELVGAEPRRGTHRIGGRSAAA